MITRGHLTMKYNYGSLKAACTGDLWGHFYQSHLLAPQMSMENLMASSMHWDISVIQIEVTIPSAKILALLKTGFLFRFTDFILLQDNYLWWLWWGFQRTVFTFALRTVQCKELVALSYSRSNSKVPREAGRQLIKSHTQKKCVSYMVNWFCPDDFIAWNKDQQEQV